MELKVSIISAIYNSEKWLEECLESLVNQTLKDIEIILINDSSPDNSMSILEEYKNKYPNLIKLIDLKENIGGGGALNRGLEIAQGEYISFVDPDDYVDMTMCEKLYAAAKKDNSDIVQFSYLRFIEKGYRNSRSDRKIVGHGLPNKFFRGGKEYGEFLTGGELLEYAKKDCILMGMEVGPHWSRFYHRDLWKKIRFPENNFYFDFPIIFFPIVLANKVTKFGEVLYHYRIRPGSVVTINSRSRCFPDHIKGCEFMVNESMRLNIYYEYKEEIISVVATWVNNIIWQGFFYSRHFYKANSDIYKFIFKVKNHISSMEKVYSGYLLKLSECCDKKNKRKLKLLFSYPRVLKFWLDLKFGAKNLWHHLLW